MNNIFLAEERLRLGFKAKEVADFAGIAIPTQSNYEKGKRSPDTRYLYEISKLGFDIHYVVTGKRSVDGVSKDDRSLLELFNNAPKAVQNYIRSGLYMTQPRKMLIPSVIEPDVADTIEYSADQKLIEKD
ncbi:helix-turn-helix domain-containing protein [Psychrobacter halodurans]|uniref:Helix-turn-helix transcriptional regulator n=1 Tax=Psychrobacter halodurans TaxID=2818439 RepID=A0AAW4IUW2_9GAMM|nr:helix-turn-helix transcriptional regulator [Psychrobacter halodurans]MBO1516944.1 helix-turn-helix transcriptional regulator [Psychrobacter halodurans]